MWPIEGQVMCGFIPVQMSVLKATLWGVFHYLANIMGMLLLNVL